MKCMIMLELSKAELKFFMTAPYTGKILVQDKMFCFTILGFIFFAGKLKIRWPESFTVQNVFLHGVVKIFDPKNGQLFKLNGQILKPFLATDLESDVDKVMGLHGPFYN